MPAPARAVSFSDCDRDWEGPAPSEPLHSPQITRSDGASPSRGNETALPAQPGRFPFDRALTFPGVIAGRPYSILDRCDGLTDVHAAVRLRALDRNQVDESPTSTIPPPTVTGKDGKQYPGGVATKAAVKGG